MRLRGEVPLYDRRRRRSRRRRRPRRSLISSLRKRQQDRSNPPESKAPAKSFSGTVVKAGEAYVLRDGSGTVFKLDDSESARPFEGKAVKVTGQLDEQAMLIHVESIEGAEA